MQSSLQVSYKFGFPLIEDKLLHIYSYFLFEFNDKVLTKFSVRKSYSFFFIANNIHFNKCLPQYFMTLIKKRKG